MLEGETSAGSGEGGGAPQGGENGAGNGGGNGNQNGAGEGTGAEQNAGGEGGEGGEGQNDDDLSSLGLDPNDKRGLKTRFVTLSDQKRQAEEAAAEAQRQAEYYKGLAEGRSQQNGGGKPATEARVDPNPKPDPNDKAKYPLGADDPHYIKDLAKYEIKAEQAAENAKKAREDAARADFNERRDNYLRAVDAAKANTDTPNAAKQLGEMVPAITDLVAVSPNAALIAEHLHNNPNDYKALVKHVGEDGRLTAKGVGEVSRKPGMYDATLPGAFASKKVSKAGTPPDNVGGGGRSSNGNDPYARASGGKPMSTEEYRAARAAGWGN